MTYDNSIKNNQVATNLKWIFYAVLLLAPLVPFLAYAAGVIPFTNLDAYIKQGRTMFIGQCLPAEDSPRYGNVVSRKIRVLSVLQGTLKPDDEFVVLVLRPLVPGNFYLVVSGSEGPNGKGELNAHSCELGTTEIQLWGEITEAERKHRITNFLESLKGKSLKEQLHTIFEMRQRQLNNEEQERKQEMDVLQKALK